MPGMPLILVPNHLLSTYMPPEEQLSKILVLNDYQDIVLPTGTQSTFFSRFYPRCKIVEINGRLKPTQIDSVMTRRDQVHQDARGSSCRRPRRPRKPVKGKLRLLSFRYFSASPTDKPG